MSSIPVHIESYDDVIHRYQSSNSIAWNRRAFLLGFARDAPFTGLTAGATVSDDDDDNVSRITRQTPTSRWCVLALEAKRLSGLDVSALRLTSLISCCALASSAFSSVISWPACISATVGS